MATEKTERQFVRAGDSTAAKKPAQRAAEEVVEAKPETKKPQNVKPGGSGSSKPAKKRAAGLRIGAVILWLAAVAFEVLTILLINGTFYIPGNKMAYLIIGIVLDLACVIAGSQLWKKANRIDPASEKQKVKFFLWNQMGVIAALIAFVPLVVLLLKDKDLDEKTKKIVSIIAVIAALLAVGTSIDYNPVSKEDLLAAQEETAEFTEDGTVYWTQFGKCYHFDSECGSIKNSKTVYFGTIEEAFEANRNRACSFCADAETLAQNRLVSPTDVPVAEVTEELTDDLLAS